jgi:hypothetical protein
MRFDLFERTAKRRTGGGLWLHNAPFKKVVGDIFTVLNDSVVAQSFARQRLRPIVPLLFLSIFSCALEHTSILTPKPNGSFPVSLNTMKLADTLWIDPYAPNHTDHAVVISLFYPLRKES